MDKDYLSDVFAAKQYILFVIASARWPLDGGMLQLGTLTGRTNT